MEKVFYLAVAGTMGVGKTTAAKFLSKELQVQLLTENFSQNQFLPRFYKDMKRWAFHSQTFFLIEKIKQTFDSKKILQAGQSVIQDTPVIQDVQSYAKAQFILGNMDEAEFQLYAKIFSQFVSLLPYPDLIVYLDAPLEIVYSRLCGRSRDFEKNIARDYLKLLDKLNKEWLKKIDRKKVLQIDTKKLNFVNNYKDKIYLAKKVKSFFKGK